VAALAHAGRSFSDVVGLWIAVELHGLKALIVCDSGK